jgi:hypothetical protein
MEFPIFFKNGYTSKIDRAPGLVFFYGRFPFFPKVHGHSPFSVAAKNLPKTKPKLE